VVRSKAIPEPTPDDITMLRDAEKTVKTLRAEAKHRVKILDDCVKQAQEIDRLLDEERKQCRFAEQRDEARRRLAAELYVAEVTPSARESDAADAVAARVAAFRELKNIVDEKVRREIIAAAAGERQDGFQGAFMWVRRQLPFG